MPVTHERITVLPPPGQTLAVDILDPETGLSVTAYAAQDGDIPGQARTLPATVPDDDLPNDGRDFWVPAGSGPYDVSATVNDVEIADGKGGLKHDVYPGTSVTPTVDNTARLLAITAPESGGSVTPVSALISFMPAPVPTATTLAFNTPADVLEGADLEINVDGKLQFLTDGLYAVSLDLHAIGDADAAGFVQANAALSGTPAPATNWFDQDGGSGDLAVAASGDTFTQVTYIPTRFAAGNILAFFIGAQLSAGTATVRAAVSATRLA
jgi:hypothetical protein